MTKRTISDDRRRMVETTRARYGEDHYARIGEISGKKKTKEELRQMALKRWHPEYFDGEGNLKEEYRDDNSI